MPPSTSNDTTRILAAITVLQGKVDTVMATLTNLQAKITEVIALQNQAITLLNQLKSGSVDQAQIDALVAALETSRAALAAAVAA